MNLIDVMTGFFMLALVGIFIGKLFNVLKYGEWYEGRLIIVGFVGATIAFLFIFVSVMHMAATNTEFVSYLWITVLLYSTTVILTISESILKFKSLYPDNSDNRLMIEREYRR